MAFTAVVASAMAALPSLLLGAALAAPTDATPEPGAPPAFTRLPEPRWLFEELRDPRLAELCTSLGLPAPDEGACTAAAAGRAPMEAGPLAGWVVTELRRKDDRVAHLAMQRPTPLSPVDAITAAVRSLGHTDLRDCPRTGHGLCIDQHQRVDPPGAGERPGCAARAAYQSTRHGRAVSRTLSARGCRAPHRLELTLRLRPEHEPLNLHH